MGFKLGSGTSKLSAWDKFKENKQNKKSPGFDDEMPFDDKPRIKLPKNPDLDDDIDIPTKPTPRPKPTRGKVPQPPAQTPGAKPKPAIGPVPLPGKPPKPTGVFDPAQGPKAKPGPGFHPLGGPIVVPGKVPGTFGGKAPTTPAAKEQLDPNCESKSGFNGNCCPAFNPKFFEAEKGGKAIRIKGGVRASDAIKDLMGSKPGEYGGLDSRLPVKTYMKYQRKFGAEADALFDQKFARMKIGITQPEVDDGAK